MRNLTFATCDRWSEINMEGMWQESIKEHGILLEEEWRISLFSYNPKFYSDLMSTF